MYVCEYLNKAIGDVIFGISYLFHKQYPFYSISFLLNTTIYTKLKLLYLIFVH